jgi:predicted dehydrogenase
MKRRGANRRTFFKVAGAAGAAGVLSQTACTPSLAGQGAATQPSVKGYTGVKGFTGGKFPPGTVMAKGRVLGANDRLLIGHVGLGGMGTGHVADLREQAEAWNAQSVALCDVYSVRIERAKGIVLGANPQAAVQSEKDYRRVLDNKDVDAVIVATPEHWHCHVAVHALQAGKHAYVQKPMARYLDEAFQLYDAWQASGKVVQVGSQGCTDPKYLAARDLVASGKLGPIVSAQSSYTRNTKAGEWNYKIDEGAGPDNLDWDMWLGSAPKRPWNDDSKARFFRYRKYRDYSAGILGDLMPHRIHPLLLTLGGASWPLKVQALGTRNVSTDREVADTVHVQAEMEGGWTFSFIGSTVNEQGLTEQVRGHKATLYLAGDAPELKPERPFAEELELPTVEVTDSGESHVKHMRNWLDSIRASKQPGCPMDLAIRAQALISLAEISEVTNKTVLFDPAKRSWSFA